MTGATLEYQHHSARHSARNDQFGPAESRVDQPSNLWWCYLRCCCRPTTCLKEPPLLPLTGALEGTGAEEEPFKFNGCPSTSRTRMLDESIGQQATTARGNLILV